MKLRTLRLAATLLTLGMLPLSAQALTATASMTVSTNITSATGSINTPPGALNFGTVNIGGGNYPITQVASTSMKVIVAQGSPYTIEIDYGLQPVGANRRMITTNSTFLYYGIFQDAQRTIPWGTLANAQAATGSGLAQTYSIDAEMSIPGPVTLGAYSDTVTVTLIF